MALALSLSVNALVLAERLGLIRDPRFYSAPGDRPFGSETDHLDRVVSVVLSTEIVAFTSNVAQQPVSTSSLIHHFTIITPSDM
jgi:hypothetical protein